MQLKELSALLIPSYIAGDAEIEFTGIQADSRKLEPGHLFFCITGAKYDGHSYAEEAIKRGAVALVAERPLDIDAPILLVKDSRHAMAIIANHYYGYPSHSMRLIGVTGTNGKTTVTYMIETILADAGLRTGLMGTIKMKIGDRHMEAGMTTQESLDIQHYLKQMQEEKTDVCIMEVSSHALDLGRVKGCRFRTAIFTNLTQDHLDYHHTMDEYRAAKGLLFARLGNASEYPDQSQFAILNADDPASGYYAKICAAQPITYGLHENADVRATNIRVTARGTFFEAVTYAGTVKVQMKLVGKFNVYNALAAMTASLIEGIPLEHIKDSLEQMRVVDGRMEVCTNINDPFLVAVDYAHTPDGLDNALSTIREFAEGRVITVFGCGGDRDVSKRPLMGKCAAKYSDYLFVTSDNPRSEDPEAILRDIVPGIQEAGFQENQYTLIADRRAAIQQAIQLANPLDIVLIAGKGHETYQIINGVYYDFDDRVIAREAIRSKVE